MHIECALLCDAATVRDGLLNILGGGVGRTALTSYPGPLSLAVALRLKLERDDSLTSRTLRAVLSAKEGAQIRVVERSFFPPANLDESTTELGLSSALSFEGVELGSPGEYEFAVYLDEEADPIVVFPLTALEPEG